MAANSTATYPVQLGGVTLQDMNAPSVLADFGSEQKVALFEFTGGTITAQLLGRFPPQLITFTQIIRGPDTMALAKQLDALTAITQQQTLTWAGWTWTGIVLRVKVEPENEGEIRYTIEFRPFNPQNPQANGDAFSPQNLFNGAVGLAQVQSISPSSGYAFPTTITGGVTNLQGAAAQALSSNSNNIANIPAATVQQLQSQVASLQSLLSPLIQGTNSQAASAAADLNNTLQQVSNALGMPASTVKQITVQDPNLVSLAAQYYGDPSLAGLIATANNLMDWQLSGIYTLKIPQNPGATASQPATLL